MGRTLELSSYSSSPYFASGSDGLMLISDVVDNGTWMSCSPHPTTTRRNVTLSQSQSSDRIGRVLSVVGPLWGLYWMVEH